MAVRQRLDSDLIAEMQSTEGQVEREFDSGTDDILTLIALSATAVALIDATKTKDQVVEKVGTIIDRSAEVMVSGVGNVARTRMDKASAAHLADLFNAGFTRVGNKWRSIADNFAGQYVRNFPTIPHRTDGVTFNTRISSIKESSQRTVRNIISNGVRDGTSPVTMADQIEQYLRPSAGGPGTSAWDQARRNAGTTRGVLSTNARYNALRIARTESLETWDLATRRFYKDSPFVKDDLWDWVLSNSHTVEDFCDILSDDGPYTFATLPVKPHPQCMCEPRPHIKTAEEVKADIERLGEDYFL